MNIGDIALAFIGGIVFLVIVGGIAAVIYVQFRINKKQAEIEAAIQNFSTSLNSTLENYKQEIGSIVDGARQGFTGIRQDIKTSQENQEKKLSATMKALEKSFADTVGKINGDALQISAAKSIQAAARIERTANLLNQILMTHEVPQETNLGAEEYAPTDAGRTIYSATAIQDQVVMQEEAQDATGLFSHLATE